MAKNFEVERKLKELRETDAPTLDTNEVVALVENIIVSLGEKKGHKDEQVIDTLKDLAGSIQKMRDDVSTLKPGDLKAYDLPSAHDELDAVVKHTELATNAILDATETIQNNANNIEQDDVKQSILDQTMLIFEHSNFQDITGQRINKVVGTLRVIEETVEKMLKAFGQSVAAPSSEEDRNKVETDEDLLSGPQLVDEANSQDDIDAILASFD